MLSAVTISLVPEARGGPFVYWDSLTDGCREAAERGFDAVEVFPPGADAIDPRELRTLLDDHGLSLAAVGTGAGWVKHKLSLTSPDGAVREKALAFVRSIMDLAAQFDAPAIIGSMQGRWGDGVTKPEALRHLGHALFKLDTHAADLGTVLLYEPLNRYETNLINTLGDAVTLLTGIGAEHVKILADLYHMNIEEANLADAIRNAGPRIGHVHFADSNRRAAGLGHTNFLPVISALVEIGYAGYLSAEVLPLPDSDTAARQTIATFRQIVG
ncbi:Sugar phosphate isomerase/epimerase OS=Singulisphaera acidiphila (strain ATCC BAA-1392 / DSM 18658 / VKM B-2454 / MOB10) GN=Sinac_2802 PE=4 SV=1: AP_endonuc_2 [Gemmata massiliana]|uniref:Xylose isomerase-like TIM barrel domain-containing protein n=1 Tax=Gemmata massiliana TaxID=1210884 RepID=A0A6P2CPT4_9BACT|nr:sugar phosphate isomerase/epimerase family protein [Gemmata massiliana]VTR90913.1 Sugar phosphate isomerase/epimerase OS=Singulisphaera acidiphila (strain ATCC BAA-1392 / DSM 18658 / VKM B-2454 / MOB10) GN=Sinac_2802 PE=4 SV=1: AP_endonuc_2 [Gemmata massiliana]